MGGQYMNRSMKLSSCYERQKVPVGKFNREKGITEMDNS